jgi:hypothetical protein
MFLFKHFVYTKQPQKKPSKMTTEWKYYPIHGISVNSEEPSKLGPEVQVPIRQEIDSWSNNPINEKQVKLFVMALSRFQKIDPKDRDSYFQIAGIHGQPNVPWDEPIDSKDAEGRGYCTHNNILFPIWHRAYLALYEVMNLMSQVLKCTNNFAATDI